MRDRQRKAMFARMAEFRKMGFSPVSSKFYAKKGLNPDEVKNKNFKQLERKGIWLKYQGDKDRDGTPNIRDCQPLNPKLQDDPITTAKIEAEAKYRKEKYEKEEKRLKDEQYRLEHEQEENRKKFQEWKDKALKKLKKVRL